MTSLKTRDIKSLEICLDTVFTRHPEVEVVSFDIFDTLLARIIEPPEAIHETLSAMLAMDVFPSMSPAQILEARKRVEQDLREQASRKGLDHECHYIDLIEAWVKELHAGPDEALIRRIREVELSLEVNALYVKEGVIPLLEHLLASGKRIIAVSDMYLGPNEIAFLLEKKGLHSLFERVYVSSQFAVCKYSGRLFQRILDEFGLRPGQVVHIGDNPVSDHSAPLKLGIHAVHLHEPRELKRRKRLEKLKDFSTGHPFFRGRFLLLAAEQRLPSPAGEDFYYMYGLGCLAPIFAAYIIGLVQRLKESSPEIVFALARDGYLLMRLYRHYKEIMGPVLSADGLPPVKYVCITRMTAAAAAAYRGLDHRMAVLALYNPKQKGLSSILKAYGLPVEPFVEPANAHGFTEMEEPLADWNDPRLLGFLNDNKVQALVRGLARPKYDTLLAYLRQIGFFSAKKIHWIDVGWNATIQYFLGKTFGDMDEYPHAVTSLMCFFNGIPYEFHKRDVVEGILYDRRRQVPMEYTFPFFEELFEESARAAHATTIGYRRNGAGKLIPVFKPKDSPDRAREMLCNGMVRQMQKGIEDGAKAIFMAHSVTGLGLSDILPYVLFGAERLIAYPKREEIKHLSRLVHTEDWGHDNVLEVNPGGYKGRLLRRFSLKDAIASSNWHYSVIKKLLGVPGVWWYRLKDLLERF